MSEYEYTGHLVKGNIGGLINLQSGLLAIYEWPDRHFSVNLGETGSIVTGTKISVVGKTALTSLAEIKTVLSERGIPWWDNLLTSLPKQVEYAVREPQRQQWYELHISRIPYAFCLHMLKASQLSLIPEVHATPEKQKGIDSWMQLFGMEDRDLFTPQDLMGSFFSRIQSEIPAFEAYYWGGQKNN
jgi:hypothetical protein